MKYQNLGQVAQCLPWCPLVSNKQGLGLHRHWAEPGVRGLGSGNLMGKALTLGSGRPGRTFLTCHFGVFLGKLSNISDPLTADLPKAYS